jgi:hypothetical protein
VKDIIFEIDSLLKNYLQKDLEFSLNGKTLKSGKLLLFEHGHFNFVFYIKTKNKEMSLKLPFPFDFSLKNDILYFDYKIKTFTRDVEKINSIVKSIKVKSPSKFYDSILKIKVV